MSGNKVAGFFAELEMRVKGLNQYDKVLKSMDALPRKLNKINQALVAHQSKMSSSLRSGAQEMEKITKKQTAAQLRYANMRMAALKKERLLQRSRNQGATLGSGYRQKKGFSRLSQVEALARQRSSSVLSPMQTQANDLKHRIRERMASAGGNQKFSVFAKQEERLAAARKAAAEATLAAEKKRQAILQKVQQEYLRAETRRQKAAQALGRREAAAQSREAKHTQRMQAMAERTAAIKAAGAQRMAAIERAAAQRAATAGYGGRGGRGNGISRSAFGGALGAATGSMAGILPGIGVGYGLLSANRINQEMIGDQLALKAITGSDEAAAATQQRFRAQAQDLGLDYRATQPSFRKMLASGMGAGMEQGAIEDTFRGVAEYGSVMGLNTEDMKGSFRAIEQIMNKGQVMSEELKLQLAERMPGVVSAMAEAYGNQIGKEVSTADLFKAMEDGSVKADVLPDFAAVLSEMARRDGALEKSKKTTRASQARFGNSISALVENMGKAGLDKGFNHMFTEFAAVLDESTGLAKLLGGAIERLGYIVVGTVRGIKIAAETLGDFAEGLGLSKDVLLGLGAAAAVAMVPFGGILVALTAVAMVIEDLWTWANGGESLFKNMFEGLDKETQHDLTNLYESLGEFFGQVKELGGNVAEILGKIFGSFGGEAFTFMIEQINSLVRVMTGLLEVINGLITADFSKIKSGLTEIWNSQSNDDVVEARQGMLTRMANTVGRAGMTAIDVALPGTPMASMYNAIDDSRSRLAAEREREAAFWQTQEDRKNGTLKYTPPVNDGSDVPKIDPKTGMPSAGIHININGVNDPAANAYAVRDVLNTWMKEQAIEVMG